MDITEIQFFILSGTLSDLSKIDFSHLNIRCLDIKSSSFAAVLDKMKIDEDDTKTTELISEISTNIINDQLSFFVLLPLDFKKTFNSDEMYSCYEIMSVIFPSDISIFGVIDFQLLDNKSLNWINYKEFGTKYSKGYRNLTNHLFFADIGLTSTNNFIKLYHNRVKSIPYIRTTIDSYVSSFSELNPTMSFLSLCICLESIIDGSHELIYRIKRNVSMLCSKKKDQAQKIYNNVNLIYKLRSKIVHGENYSLEKVQEYLPYLRNLVSRMIIRLILLNIQSKKQLDKVLTFLGFGNADTVNDDYQEIEPNFSTMAKIVTVELVK